MSESTTRAPFLGGKWAGRGAFPETVRKKAQRQQAHAQRFPAMDASGMESSQHGGSTPLAGDGINRDELTVGTQP